MKRTSLIHLLAAALLLLAGSTASLSQSIDFKVGSLHVRATAVSETVFRMSVNDGNQPAERKTAFLDPSREAKEGVGRLSESKGTRSITTSAGELQIDPIDGTYALRDATGYPLARFAPIAIPL